MGRKIRAALVGAAAAGTYLAGSRLAAARPVKGAGLALLALAAITGAQASVKAASVEQRFNDLINGQTPITLPGLSMTGDLYMSGHALREVDAVHSNGGGIGFWDKCYMNGNDFYMTGNGTAGADIHMGTGHVI